MRLPKTLNIIGLDIGGANTKAALITIENGFISSYSSIIEYFPFWEHTLKKIPEMLMRVIKILKSKLEISDVDFYAISITAELSDAFQTKREGIFAILDALIKVVDEKKLHFISNKGQFIKIEALKSDPIQVAAANWVATALYLGKYVKNAILIDAGSTTIDIIPLLEEKPSTVGKTDLGRLKNHELIYTGGLRATIPSITHFVPYHGKLLRISFERFALISDVHMILNNITEEEYINDTADNRSKSLQDCYARLSRIICADIESLTKNEIFEIAQYIYEKQIELISSELELFIKNKEIDSPQLFKNLKFVITGLSAEFLIKPVLTNLGYGNIYKFEDLTNIPDNISSSAYAVAGALYHQLL